MSARRSKSIPNRSLEASCEQLLPHMIDHVFLPKHLETEYSGTRLKRTEKCLLATVCDIIKGFKSTHFPGSVKHLFTGMKQLYVAGEMNPKTLSTQISTLEANQMMGIYIRKANCAMFLMRTQSDDELIVATFQANLTNEAIYGDVEGGKINGDIQVDYPTRAIKVKMSELVKSEVFAEQIVHFHQFKQNKNEDKNQADAEASMQKFVSQWLIGAVSGRDSDVATDFPIISKKMRDEPSHGFRRSGFWIAIKVFLQLGLTVELGETIGKCVYKMTMLRLMAKMCSNLMDVSDHSLNVDTAVEMLSKTARRMEKLNMFRIADESIRNEMVQVKAETAQLIENVRIHLEKHHAKYAIKDVRLSTQKRLKFAEHVVHTLTPDFTTYLSQRKDPIYSVNVKIEKIEPDEDVREPEVYDPQVAPNLAQLVALDNGIDKLRLFNHIENWVLKHLDDADVVPPTYLRDLATEYFAKARDFYKSDPIGYSKMVLTMLKIIQFLDKRACDDLKIFSHHKSGVSPNIVDNLTLTSRHHLEVLSELQTYFKKRNTVANFPGLIEQNQVTNKSFAARYAKQDAGMLEVKKMIQLEDERKIAEKIDEVKLTREKIHLDRLSVAEKKCYCADYTYTNCEKCRIQTQINDTRIPRYRSVIMPEQHKLYALVFELQMPDVIACLRDLLYVFVTKHYDCRLAKWPRKCVSWTEQPILQQFSKGCSTKYVFLGTDSDYVTKRSTRDDDFNEQIDALDDDFIDRSTSSCLMCGVAQPKATKMPTSTRRQLIKKSVTFSVEPTSVYGPLQWTLESTNHSQNRVLASQSDCPANLSAAEYINFGSLRGDGHRLHLRNLHRVLVEEGLSFETPSVLTLVMQTLYEVGPSNTEWYRESNQDFVCLEFVHTMVDFLEAYIQRQQENWKNPLKLMVATLIVCRMIEINSDSDTANRLVAVLLQFRLTAINWMRSIRATIENDNSNVGDLHANLVDIAICGIHTFFVDRHHADFEKIFEPTGEYSAVNAWLRFVVTANHYYASCDQSPQRESRELLMRMAHTIGLNIECRLGALIANNPDQVQEYVGVRYKGLEAIHSRYGVRHLQHKRHTIVVDAKIRDEMLLVQIDYVFGEFLVNGLPMGRLPEAITKHAIYKRMFGNTTFEVQPKGRAFSTVAAHRDRIYIFREHVGDGIAITEHYVDVSHCINIDSTISIKELIPHTRLSKMVPFMLVENFSHWLNRERNVIEFRPKSFNDADFASDIQYEFFLQTGLLHHVKTKRQLLDVRSESYKKVAELMERLDHSNCVTVLMEDAYRARVELPRMKLTFTIDCQLYDIGYEIQSNEYSGMRVSLNQNVGTLFGLKFGLVLESMDNASNRLLIMPHSKFNVHSTETDHHVEVKLASYDVELRSPPFFIYSIDDQLRTLKATSFAAWFYLAHLHTVTSCPFPDPFTGMTGVERALQILQSGLAWSPSPYDRESMSTLQSLADLSPARKFQSKRNKGAGHHQQSTIWPKNIRSHAAHDAFVLIVNKLVSDSVRLAHLFMPNQKKPSIKISTTISLNARSYARYVQYASNCGISESFLTLKHLDAVTHSIAAIDDRNLLNVRKLAVLFNGGEFCVPSDRHIDEMLFNLFSSEKILSGRPHKLNQAAISVQSFCASSSFANLWIVLYELIRRKQLPHEHLHLILTLFAFQGIDVHHLFVLQAIAANPKAFEKCKAPRFEFYEDVHCVDIDAKAIKGAIDAAKKPIAKFIKNARSKVDLEKEKQAKEKVVKRKYDSQIKSIKQKVIETVNSQWPCETIDMRSIDFNAKVIYVNATVASDIVNSLLGKWYRNYMLREFARKIAKKLAKISKYHKSPPFTGPPEWPMCAADAQPFPKYAIDFDKKMCKELGQHAVAVELARQIFVENKLSKFHPLDHMWEKFRDISIPESEHHLVSAQLYPRLVPTTVFPRLLRTKNTYQRYLIGALAVTTSRVQQAARNALEKNETATMHENWQPDQHPEWLLFEIEMSLSIRRVQVEIANRMINPPDNENSVMQLNMGEGKTSVIVPIVAAELANGQQLCTVNVLRQLFQTNLRSLRQCTGGLLGRRVYTLPCRRDLDIESDVDAVQQVLEECKKNRGILMTVPEHRLSLQLKIYDATRKNRTSHALKLLHVHNWLNKNSRHILDESDAILQPNYQLIYSTGKQNSPEGGVLRWTCIQALLKRVPHHMKGLQRRTECQRVEYNADYVCDGVILKNRPEIFTPCRLLDTTIAYDRLKKSLADDIYAGKISEFAFTAVTPSQRSAIRDILLIDDLSENEVNTILEQFDNQSIRHTILILCGLLKFGVLKLALSKRWRVNYGRNVNGTRKMAVPFKAKDVAVEMTEFGHPDVAICLTQLSYYYSGLSDVELREAFLFLDRSEDPQGIYQEWIRKVPSYLVPKSIATYNGVNLSDAKQRTEELFPIMRRNMYVIDYWLAHVVFPREAKLFDEKLMCTPWDLCTEQLRLPVTGFSGTNDTKELLPLPINQNDLPELLKTNEMVQATLLREENDNYHFLAANVSGMAILEKLVNDGIPVLLDAGALVLELNNEQVAREWLKMVPNDKYDAAVYFSDKDIMLTIDRNDFITEFEYSAFRERLDRCVVYLDDVHTRGTDLKFPVGTQACVTLSGGITHDKTVQACMRMRLLGRGHRISFWASQEAHIGILSGAARTDRITTADVIKYVGSNSDKFKRDFVSHWFNASVNYAQKVAAHKSLDASKQLKHETDAESSSTRELLEKLRKRCSNSEKLSLNDLYGAKSPLTLTKIARNTYVQYVNEHEANEEITDWIHDIEQLVLRNLKRLAPDMKINTHNQYLDGECQKELEYELEENREVHRPKMQKPLKPHFCKKLTKLFGASNRRWEVFEKLKDSNTIQPLANALKNTKLYEDANIAQNLDGWSNNLWVTKDFLSVIQLNADDNRVDFLRPVWWVVRMHTEGKERYDKDTFILISPFECNELMPLFRQNIGRSTLHMFSAKLSATQPTLINNRALQLPLVPETQPIPLETVVQLAMFAGSMYFENAAEELEYCNFMGIIPSPTTEEQAKVLKSVLPLMKCGYIPTKFREYFPELRCGFRENPGKIAMGIIQMRHGYARKRSHAAQINIESKRFKWAE